jgi:4-hydroxybutyryl-CoA dehydratase/vinylacetyl-CoA-Delta-isomerase
MGNVKCGKFTTLILFNDVFVPWDRVFMCGEHDFAGPLVRTFAAYHRHSHGGCKSGWADVAIGAASAIAEYNGIAQASHINEKLTDMIHMAETMYGCAIASSVEGRASPSGIYTVDSLLANTSKLHEGRVCYEICRLLLDIAGGLVGTMPSEKDFQNPEIGGLLSKYLKGAASIPTEHRVRLFRLIEKLTFESRDLVSDVHGGGSPQAHRMTILRDTDLRQKRRLARVLAGIEDQPEEQAGE